MFWFISFALSILLCIQSAYLLTFTVRRKTKFHITLTVSFLSAMLTLLLAILPIFPLYYFIKIIVWVIGSWVLLTVYAYRRPVLRLRVYEYSVMVWFCLIIRILPGPDPYMITLVVLSVYGLYIAYIVQQNAFDEFAIGITSRERKNPFYIRWYKKVAYEEVYVPPSLVGNKDIQETIVWHYKGCLFFAMVHLSAIIEITAFIIGMPDLALCVDLFRIGIFHMVHYYAIKIVN